MTKAKGDEWCDKIKKVTSGVTKQMVASGVTKQGRVIGVRVSIRVGVYVRVGVRVGAWVKVGVKVWAGVKGLGLGLGWG